VGRPTGEHDAQWTGPRLGRRELLRRTAGSAVVGGLALAACGPVKSRPSVQAPVVTITFQPYFGAIGQGQVNSAVKLAQQALEQYSSQGGSKGIRIQVAVFPGTDSNISAMTAGGGADVVYDYHYAPYIEAGVIAPLEDFVKEFGVDESIWSAGQIAVYKQNGHLYAVPAYMGTVCYALNLSVFDAVGVSYPTADWTYKDFVTLCTQLTGTANGQLRYGGMLYQWNNMIDGSRWIFNAFGGSLMNADGTQSTLDTPGSLAAGDYMFKQLYWPKICTTRSVGNYQALFQQGLIAMRTLGTWEIFTAAVAYQDNVKWDILPFPLWPAGRTTFSTDDFWAVNQQSKHLKEAAEVAIWASSSPYWNRFNMELQLLSPARVDMWDEWATTVQKVAPPLHGKALNWYGDAAQKGYALAPLYYKYNDPQCETAVGNIIYQLYTQQLTSVSQAFAEADKQVDAIIQQGAQQAAASSSSAAGSSSSSSASSSAASSSSGAASSSSSG